MTVRALKQYLELMKNSGIDELTTLHRNEERGDVDVIAVDNSINEQNEENKESGMIMLTEPQKESDSPQEINNAARLQDNREKYKDCRKCSLHTNRTNVVYGEGNPNAAMMIIGEGPGAEENLQGKPFVGRAGQLLTKMLGAITIKREDVYIANIVKCQPPDNRNPLPDETAQCLPYLWEQIDIIQPRLIILLGKVAAANLLGATETLGQLRLKKFALKGIETYVTYHPAALLRNPSLKKLSWIDLQKYRDIYREVANNK